MKNLNKNRITIIILVLLFAADLTAQQSNATHTRGKLWETLVNWGFIGDPGAWDFTEITGIGMYPGFSGFTFPNNEQVANGFITDADFHNFRSGPWIIAKDATTLVPPAYTPQQKDFLLYHSSLASPSQSDIGALVGSIPPFQKTKNFIGTEGFNPLLPEEMNYTEFATNTGITVKQRSMSWSYPGYSDFIIYDYVFKNTGDIAFQSINQVKHLEQTLNEVWFVFHSGISASVKGRINFHYNSDFLSSIVPAGGFGWHPGSGYTDYYTIENNALDGKGLLFYSRNFNGGRAPVPWDGYGLKTGWQKLLTHAPYTLPELQDPSAFGFTFLYRTPTVGGNLTEPDPDFFNVYSDEQDKFNGKVVDFEGFGLQTFSPADLYQFARQNHLSGNNGKLYCWYTSSFGPYKLAPGDSVRLIVAEIAGSMDVKQVVKGDPEHWLKNYDEDWQHDSVSAAIHRNVENLRNAFKWGFGAKVNGIDIVADVPEPPPAPNCTAFNVSYGTDTAIIAVQWDKLAETTKITDGSGSVFYDGATDLSGYRIYRGNDMRGVWDLLIDIPSSDFSKYYNPVTSQYEYTDKSIQFGFEFNYYVQAYNSHPKPWTSANLTLVPNLPELKSADYNKTVLIGAKPGPVSVDKGWDIFVAPNPYVEGDPNRSFGEPTPRKIEFRNLPESAVIHIYTVSGDLVKVLIHTPDAIGNLSGSIDWDQRSDSGLLVAPGLYIYVVQSQTKGSEGSKTRGKLMIIR
jgi:hypothetical protein